MGVYDLQISKLKSDVNERLIAGDFRGALTFVDEAGHVVEEETRIIDGQIDEINKKLKAGNYEFTGSEKSDIIKDLKNQKYDLSEFGKTVDELLSKVRETDTEGATIPQSGGYMKAPSHQLPREIVAEGKTYKLGKNQTIISCPKCGKSNFTVIQVRDPATGEPVKIRLICNNCR